VHIVRELLDRGKADFCEILIDNFIHLNPDAMREVLGDTPVAFHIMWSRFIERDEKSLSQLAQHIRLWIEKLKPVYVSDHLAQFTMDERTLPLLAELDYDACYSKVRDRVLHWQDELHTSIFLENFPSTLDYDGRQIEFYTCLLSDVECGLLFDFSNSIVASINCGVDASRWLPLAGKGTHYHIAGFRKTSGEPKLAIDTHDVPVSNESVRLAESVFLDCNHDKKNRTIVVERDANITFESWEKDLSRVRFV
jgi:uncharacterized protein (UPF0276 family)